MKTAIADRIYMSICTPYTSVIVITYVFSSCIWLHGGTNQYRQVSNISRTQSQNINVSRLVL